jgi:hypothetical protein
MPLEVSRRQPMPVDLERVPIVAPVLSPDSSHAQQPGRLGQLDRAPHGAFGFAQSVAKAIAGVWWPVDRPTQFAVPGYPAHKFDQ